MICDKPEKADLIVFNTCCVRKGAEQKVYGRLGEFKELKRKKADLIIAVLGCMAQNEKEKLIEKFPQINLVLGPDNLGDLKNCLKELKTGKATPLIKINGSKNSPLLKPERKGKVSAHIPISTGCSCFCSFCIVPYVRGRLKSRPFEKIIDQAEQLAREGCKEIIFLGQNVNAYGKDSPGFPAFIEILEKTNKIKGIERIRYISPNPKDFNFEFIERLSGLSKVCPHIHLPLQSGDDEILKKMGRGYDSSEYTAIVNKLRGEIPQISITTDIIVGFPGETESQFEKTLGLVKEIKFDGAFMFAYSPREKTRAFNLPEELTKEEKLQRLKNLIEAQNNISHHINKGYLGRELEVLPESVSWKNSDCLAGHTANYKNVVFNAKPEFIGKLTKVEMVKAYTWGLYGEKKN